MATIVEPSFALGELSDALSGRIDMEWYGKGLAKAKNFYILPSGGATLRPGTEFVGQVPDMTKRSRLVPFVFNGTKENNYALLWNNGRIYPIQDGGFVTGKPAFTASSGSTTTAVLNSTLTEEEMLFDLKCTSGTNAGETRTITAWNASTHTATFGTAWSSAIASGDKFELQNAGGIYSIRFPYFTEDELPGYDYAQSTDTLYVTHENRKPRKILRLGHTEWTFETMTFTPKISTPTNLAGTTNHSTGSGGDDATVEYSYKVTAYTADGDESAPTAAVTIESRNLGLDNTQITLTWTKVSGASEYKIYKDTGGTFGLVGYAPQSNSPTWVDKNYSADLSVTPVESENPFPSAGNYPSCVGFIQQRLVFAGTKNNPQKVWMSRSGNFENFGRSNPTQDDDAIYISIYSRQASWIRALMSMRGLFVLTGGTEYNLTGGTTDAVLTPSECRANQQSAYGSARLRPVAVGNSIIMLQRGGHVVRDMAYDYTVDGYQGNDISIRSAHLLHGHTIVSWCYQSAPDGVLWAVRDDGIMLTLTYNREHQIFAWTRHETDGQVEDVCCVPGDERDEVYMIVRREVDGSDVRYVERLAEPFRDLNASTAKDAWYVDCGLKYDGVHGIKATGGTTTTAVLSVTAYEEEMLYELECTSGTNAGLTRTITAWDSDTNTATFSEAWPSAIANNDEFWLHRATDALWGLEHLEGKTVAVLADGGPLNGIVVGNSAITLPRKYYNIIVGLPYEGFLKSLRVAGADDRGPSQGRRQKIGDLKLRFDRTVGGEVGWERYGTDGDVLEEKWSPIKYRTLQIANQPSAPFSGDREARLPAGWDNRGQFMLRQRDPLPMTLLCAILNVTLGEK